MNTLLYGPAGTGKTTELLQRYVALKKAGPFRKDVYFLVPTDEHADRIKTLVLAKINPLFFANIKTLDSFFCAGQYLQPLDKEMILQKICRGLELKFFPDALTSGTFYTGLAELLSELKNYCIALPDFLSKLRAFNPAKSTDLARIFEAYAAYLQKHQLQDKEDALTGYAPPTEHLHIFLDGFTEFTPLQYRQIRKLADNGHELQAAIVYAETQPELFPAEAENTFREFTALGFQPERRAEYKRGGAADLRTFALHWGGANPEKQDVRNIKMLTGGNRQQEIECIAREIAGLKLNNPALRWSDIAIILRSIGSYQFLINEVFRHYAIPVETHEGIAMLSNPFCGWLLSLREIKDNAEALFSFLKSAYAQTDKTKVHQLEFSAEPEASLNVYIERITEQSEKLQQAQTFRAIKEILEEVYAENACAQTLKADRRNSALKTSVRHSNRVYAGLLETLDKLQRWQDKLELEYPAELLWAVFIHNLQEKTAARSRNGEQVQVYDALSARQKDYKIVFLADLTAHSWPAGAAESLLLKDYEKERLALGFKRAAAKIRNEDLIFYQSFTRAGKRVYLCRARREASGNKLNVSPYLPALQKFFTEIPELKYERTAVLGTDKPLCREEYEQTVIYRFFNNDRAALQSAVQSAREKDLQYVLAVLRQKNDPEKLHQFSAETKQELQKLNRCSVTKLEKYSRCAFQFFCEDVLQLKGRPEDATLMTIGSLMHKALEIYYQQPSELDRLVEQIWESADFRNRLKHILPGQAAAERKKINSLLKLFIQKDQELSKTRNFSPQEYEKKLSAADNTAYPISGNLLTGTIDRIDKNNAGDFLILDYKSSQLPAVRQGELAKGILPQVLVYALIYKELGGGSPAGVEYCSLRQNKRSGLYAAEYPGLTKSRNIISAAEFSKILDGVKNKISEYYAAIQNGEFQRQNDEQCSEYCTAGEICRRRQTGAKV